MVANILEHIYTFIMIANILIEAITRIKSKQTEEEGAELAFLSSVLVIILLNGLFDFLLSDYSFLGRYLCILQ